MLRFNEELLLIPMYPTILFHYFAFVFLIAATLTFCSLDSFQCYPIPIKTYLDDGKESNNSACTQVREYVRARTILLQMLLRNQMHFAFVVMLFIFFQWTNLLNPRFQEPTYVFLKACASARSPIKQDAVPTMKEARRPRRQLQRRSNPC